METSLEVLKKWMDLTEQQFDIFSTILQLELKKELADTKSINERYKIRFQHDIQRSNLYTILKILKDKMLIYHSKNKGYTIDYNGVGTRLEELKNRREEENREIDKLYNNTRDYIRSNGIEPQDTLVKYHDNKGISEILTKSLASATSYYTTDRFPNVALSQAWIVEDWKQRYVNLIYYRSVIKKELEVYYLSDLNIERYYRFMSEFYNNNEFAFKECLSMLNKLENLLENNENIHVAVSDGIFVIDVHLPEHEEPTEYVSHMHDLQSRTLGGIYIKSFEAAGYIKQYFLKKFDASIKMEGRNRKRIINQSKCRLNEIHDGCSKNKKKHYAKR